MSRQKLYTIRVFENDDVAKNASIESDPIYLGNIGGNIEERVMFDITASGPGGYLNLSYKVNATQGGDFFTPSTASPVCASHRGGTIATGSRDLYTFTLRAMPWIKIKALENNASPVRILVGDLVIRQS